MIKSLVKLPHPPSLNGLDKTQLYESHLLKNNNSEISLLEKECIYPVSLS